VSEEPSLKSVLNSPPTTEINSRSELFELVSCKDFLLCIQFFVDLRASAGSFKKEYM